jgi:hypothetical protein
MLLIEISKQFYLFTMLGEPLGIIKKIFNVSMVGGPK